jgi:hypothetical protein
MIWWTTDGPATRSCLVVTVLLAASAACGPSRPAGAPAPERGATPATGNADTADPGTASDWFVDGARESGLDFVHANGMSGQMYIAEIMAPGVGLLDYDNDGDLDVYAVQGAPLAPAGVGAARAAPPSAAGGDRLFRNDLQVRADGTRVLRFTDVTEEARLRVQTYGMGVAAADVDNDGWVDLYLSRFGADVLLRNTGKGTFADATATAGLSDAGWTVPASFFDFDRDGWLDLYVGSYLRYGVESDIHCFGPTGARDYCSPQNYSPLPGRLFRNRRDGTFADLTVASGLARDYGPALGSVAADLDDDGWPDLYVANDGAPNQLWLNRRDGTFRNAALLAGVAVNGDGRAEGSMGADAGDFDGDGDDDLLIANLAGEGSTLYANDGRGVFQDVAAATGLRSASLPFTGFGAAWIDYDNDGWLDILTVNGAIQTIQALAQAGDRFPLHQRKQLLRYRPADRRFEDVTGAAGRVFSLSDVGRGAAFGDIDNDGDTDVLVGNNNGPLRLVVNQIGQRRHWLGVRAVGRTGADALGARVGVVMADGATRWRRARADGSYASANDPRVLVGLGDATAVAGVRIRWPNGRTEAWPQRDVNRWITLREGSGTPVS